MAEGYAPKEFEERVLELNRVSKKSKGGNKMHFSALVAIGDKNGRIGFAHAKAKDVATAVSKAMRTARNNVVTIKIKDGSIPHEVRFKYGASEILFKPAPKGTGIIAGGAVRQVLELVGIKDISAKMFRSSNKLLNVKTTVEALKSTKG